MAGSVGKSGAAALAGRAALRMGAGLVTVAVPAGVLPSVARTMAELMTEPLAGTPEGTVAAEALPRAARTSRREERRARRARPVDAPRRPRNSSSACCPRSKCRASSTPTGSTSSRRRSAS
ncbi:MAG: hypothetical protein M0C28_42360 [Candidatus Moduliflexus flocculans]|nr:hypothetical protein [Candidatus Moduliflexus flocculans]